MAEVGDRIAVVSKGVPRPGVVTAVSGAMITVRWDTGEETSLIPGPGVLSVVAADSVRAHSSEILGRDDRGQDGERGRLQEGRSWQEAGG